MKITVEMTEDQHQRLVAYCEKRKVDIARLLLAAGLSIVDNANEKAD